MEYYFSKTLNLSFEQAKIHVTEALKTKGLGIVSEISMHEKFKEKLNVDFKRYLILGACSPSHAYKAVQHEDKIGTMLPCNVLVIEQKSGQIEIAAVNPLASMQAISNPELGIVAEEITNILKTVIENL